MHRKTEEILSRTKIYFVSDAHFGVDSQFTTGQREKLFVEWLDSIKGDASELYLLGDIFDFWFEYSYVVPRGFVTVLAKLRELSDAGVKIKYFTGLSAQWPQSYSEIPRIPCRPDRVSSTRLHPVHSRFQKRKFS